MNWPARFFIAFVLAAPCLPAAHHHTGTHAAEPAANIQHASQEIISAIPSNIPIHSNTTTVSEMTGSPLSDEQASGASAATLASPYQRIVDRNLFKLQPSPLPTAQPVPPSPPPKEDLFVTGLCDLFTTRSASFRIVETGQPPASFTLAEGERNDWLEVLSVNMPNQTVQVRLKKPVVRIRSVGVEVLLKLQSSHQRT